ncbi:hypothetical protein CCGE525_14895 [Rhizobium jaguaris]|uniref:Peptidase M41 domain-containing protein n=1 Tax=Rhizobium jaguaris TaxID=1312183 RepID=A0A387FVQ1_9HYPH|nr:hypothetical protein CCGE525_14895 [Rhizobium jaguaris]
MASQRDQSTITAYHEAGHAVMEWHAASMSP